MKKMLLTTVLLGIATMASGKSFDEKMERECLYVAGDKDAGRYDSESHGYSLGVVTGVLMMTPADQRTSAAKKSLGYLSDAACLDALKDTRDRRFIFKYQDAVRRLIVR